MNLLKILLLLGITVVIFPYLSADFSYTFQSEESNSSHIQLMGSFPYSYQITIHFLKDNYTYTHLHNGGSYPIVVTVEQQEQALTIGQLKQVNLSYNGVITTPDHRLKGDIQVTQTVTEQGTSTLKDIKEKIRKNTINTILEKIRNL